MAQFEMCADCHAEYTDPTNRRFHAQPVACPRCGPQVWLEIGEDLYRDMAISKTQSLLSKGSILAIKGLGGFHLACDATNLPAVSELRARKLRVDKPFALMMPDIETVESHCYLNPAEKLILESRARPILIVAKRESSPIVQQVAPGQQTIGVMLPYTPLHYLLFKDYARNQSSSERSVFEALVMTSGNVSEEPIAYDNDDARQRLASLADGFLMHNRSIHTRCDDSVMRLVNLEKHLPQRVESSSISKKASHPPSGLMPIRRSRGYAPYPVLLPIKTPPVLAVGGELKNTFCLTRDRYAFLSHHIGDLENYETLTSFENAIAHYERLFRVKPQAIAYDLHPDYMASRYALKRGSIDNIPTISVQHHHAHIAACLAENSHPGNRTVIGVSFDGTGYGEDGAIWGGEFLLVDYRKYFRSAHLAYVPLPGGDKSTKEPWRIALSWLHQANIPWEEDLLPLTYALAHSTPNYNLANILLHQIQSRLNSPLTSSMGRLFDAAASLIGVRQVINYEAQAAIELEAIADPSVESAYPFEIQLGEIEKSLEDIDTKTDIIINPSLILAGIIHDLRSKTPIETIAAKFQNSIANMVVTTLVTMRNSTSISEVALSGGVWQNVKLLSKTLDLLQKEQFQIYLHTKVPCNDGGIALGQAAVASYLIS
jgi:hydrogenase maturation protein HypF